MVASPVAGEEFTQPGLFRTLVERAFRIILAQGCRSKTEELHGAKKEYVAIRGSTWMCDIAGAVLCRVYGVTCWAMCWPHCIGA